MCAARARAINDYRWYYYLCLFRGNGASLHYTSPPLQASLAGVLLNHLCALLHFLWKYMNVSQKLLLSDPKFDSQVKDRFNPVRNAFGFSPTFWSWWLNDPQWRNNFVGFHFKLLLAIGQTLVLPHSPLIFTLFFCNRYLETFPYPILLRFVD